MQAAQWGWLHATPEKYGLNRLAMYGEPVGIEAALDGEYLIDALHGVGWDVCQAYSPWAELVAYGAATGRVSEHWEYEAIMAMSRAYVRAINEGKDVHCIAPVDRDREE